ncbi:hypothetical protein HPB52_008968 [Rhipicephalus sanguineus]|uniref:Reverse transcriptase domain-containing protein n=1 Tax=Rhipicephalus sanguineus TaxID=34632 RepID=A0A9D4PSA7_RHISA|nr:hypothetical protein HPB52_008968 [Rhipicephalus sanguineus]
MDQDKLTHECRNVTSEDEASTSNIRPQRTATLSRKAEEIYETCREEHCRKLDAVWKNVEIALHRLSCAKEGHFTSAATQLRASYERYEHVTARYASFLDKANTSEARQELQLQKAIDADHEAIVSEKLREATQQERENTQETASQLSISAHSRASSRSRRSGSSTISLAAVQARALAEAIKARAEFGCEEAAMRLEKARIEAELECSAPSSLSAHEESEKTPPTKEETQAAVSPHQPNQQHRFFTGEREDIKGRNLYDLMTLEGITLLTEPAYPTRTGNSVSRDTCPDLTMGINLPQPRWWNSQENLGSDHFIIHTSLSYDSTRGTTRRSLQRVIHGFPGDNANLLRALQSKYVNTTRDRTPILLYDGPDNPELSKAFTVVEVKVAILCMRKGTAPGPDEVLIGLLSNLIDDMTQLLVDKITDRRVTIRIGDLKSQPITMGDFGTPQGAALSPLLFNIALMRLPEALNRISEVRRAIYADDVTIWTRSGNLCQIEEAFQQAASVVEQMRR